MAAVRHLRFVWNLFGPRMKGSWWSVQNMVVIDAVVSIIRKFEYLAHLA